MCVSLSTKVTAKGFFRGTEAGEPEYKDRYRKMVLRFKDKVKAQQGGAAAPAANALPPPPPGTAAEGVVAAAAPSAGDEAAAEAFKTEGNLKLQGKDFEGAVAAYTAAVQASPDGPKSHIYFANRAAARQYLKQHQVGEKAWRHLRRGRGEHGFLFSYFLLFHSLYLVLVLSRIWKLARATPPDKTSTGRVARVVGSQGALDDCDAALARDPNYVKGHVRMAASHAALGDWAAAVEAYETANRLEPGNAGTMAALKQVCTRRRFL